MEKWDELNKKIWDENAGRELSVEEYLELVEDFESVMVEIRKAHEACPFLRFGQLIENAIGPARLYYGPNAELARLIEIFRLKQLEAKSSVR